MHSFKNIYNVKKKAGLGIEPDTLWAHHVLKIREPLNRMSY